MDNERRLGRRLPRTAFAFGQFALLGCLLFVLPILRGSPIELPLLLLGIMGVLWLSVRRLHDRGFSGFRLLWALVPIVGLLWLLRQLFFCRGSVGENQYGPDPLARQRDHLRVEPSRDVAANVVEEVTRLYPTEVFAITKPTTLAELREALQRTTGPISVGGGHFSMGGQVASPNSLHIDMRSFNRVLALSLEHKSIRVEAGIRWCDIQRVIDPHDLSIQIMQSYANFTVGGSLSVNVHGRYVGLGPLVLSVLSIDVLLLSGELVHASRDQNSELFWGMIGGYGALGIIVYAELALADNDKLLETQKKLSVHDYAAFFAREVRNNQDAIFHNADLYLPHGESLRAVTFVKTKRAATPSSRLMQNEDAYPLQNYFAWAVSETPLGRWRREHIFDPLRFAGRKVFRRNYEAGYNVAELEPPSRKQRSYVLQEYFVPVAEFEKFSAKMIEIFNRHRANVLNVSVRHAMPDDGTLLAWAPEEVFAFVIYYKQRTRPNAKERVAVWTRELIEASLECGGRYYLPYQAHATPSQFHRAYPGAQTLFEAKKRFDPDFRLRHILWDKYYADWLAHGIQHETSTTHQQPNREGEFRAVYGLVASSEPGRAKKASEFSWNSAVWSDRFYLFLQNVYRLYPEDRFHHLILEACRQQHDDEGIYKKIQTELPRIKPLLGDLTYALPSLAKQKAEIAKETRIVLGDRKELSGYLEYGTPGRYVRALRSQISIQGPIFVANDVAPTMSPVDIVERGGFGHVGTFLPMNDYQPIPSSVPDASLDLVTVYIGLHHIKPDELNAFLASIGRVLRNDGLFILRDHDVTTVELDRFVALAHTVFNCGLHAAWSVNAEERRYFTSVDTWVQRVCAHGFVDTGHRILQPHDPTLNTLLGFRRTRT